jgi:NTP pyrophosphatase (non-canonical NTP hydrolase)
MDAKTTLSELKLLVKQFNQDRGWDKYHTAKNLASGMITEAAELLEHFRFLTDSEGEAAIEPDSKIRQEIIYEIMDVFYYILRLAEKYDIDITTEFKKKLAKNAIKYPAKKNTK